MKKLGLIIFLIFFQFSFPAHSKDKLQIYAIAKFPVPVFNTPDITEIFKLNNEYEKKLMDDCYNMKKLEFIAFSGTVFTVDDTLINNKLKILKVSTNEYPYPSKGGYFVDSRFVKIKKSKTTPSKRKIKLPSRKQIIQRLLKMEGQRYTWGGNYYEGVTKLETFYRFIDNRFNYKVIERLLFKGVDCSGLLYQATDGYTPRNTSKLINYGKGVKVSGLNMDQMIEKVRPLDLILWKGHMMIILDEDRIIDSRIDYDKSRSGCQGGVKVYSLNKKLREILATKIALDEPRYLKKNGKKTFVIRRWYTTGEIN